MSLAVLVSDLALDVFFQSSILCLCLLSAYLCYKTFSDHLSVGRQLPGLQICCFRVVAIAPAYAFLTWLKLMFLPALVVWKTLSDLCEAYAIYCYWVMLILWCGGQKQTISQLEEQDRGSQSISCCPLFGVYMGKRSYSCPLYTFSSPHSHFKFWRRAMTQLIVVKLGANILNTCLMLAGSKGLGRPLHFVELMSTGLAMHCIIETYVALRAHLEHFHAEKKFICIKILIGVTLLQPLLTNALETIGAFPDDVLYGYSSRKWSQRVLGTVSVIQMVVFSLLLSFAFSLKYTLREQKAADLGSSSHHSGGANGNHVDLEMSSSGRSNAGQSSLLLTSSGNNSSSISSARGLSTTMSSAGLPVEMVKFWDVLLCHTISDESFTFGTGKSTGNMASSKSGSDIALLATTTGSRGADGIDRGEEGGRDRDRDRDQAEGGTQSISLRSIGSSKTSA
jgi:hypothetical protein